MSEPEDSSYKIGYMCAIAWDWELGEACGGTKVYCSMEDLKREHKCVSSCGIVKVKVELIEIIDEGRDFDP